MIRRRSKQGSNIGLKLLHALSDSAADSRIVSCGDATSCNLTPMYSKERDGNALHAGINWEAVVSLARDFWTTVYMKYDKLSGVSQLMEVI